MYGAAAGLQKFETEVAGLLGKEKGLFFPTGTLAQRAALHSHLEQLGQPGRLLLHQTSHLVHHDCLRDGQRQAKRARLEAEERLPMFKVALVGEFQCPLALKDFEVAGAQVSKGDVVAVELPQRMNGGRTMAWDDLVKLAAKTREAGARLHMDGARIWEAQPFYGVELRKICELFDSVYVSFYKGLGGMNGAMLCSTEGIIGLASQWRARLGGSLFTLAPHWLDAREQLQSGEGSFAERFRKLREVVSALSADATVGSAVRFEPPLPESCMVHGYLKGTEQDMEEAHAKALKASGIRLWNRLRGRGYASDGKLDGLAAEVYFEWNMGPANAAIPTEIYLRGWKAFAEELNM